MVSTRAVPVKGTHLWCNSLIAGISVEMQYCSTCTPCTKVTPGYTWHWWHYMWKSKLSRKGLIFSLFTFCTAEHCLVCKLLKLLGKVGSELHLCLFDACRDSFEIRRMFVKLACTTQKFNDITTPWLRIVYRDLSLVHTDACMRTAHSRDATDKATKCYFCVVWNGCANAQWWLSSSDIGHGCRAIAGCYAKKLARKQPASARILFYLVVVWCHVCLTYLP